MSFYNAGVEKLFPVDMDDKMITPFYFMWDRLGAHGGATPVFFAVRERVHLYLERVMHRRQMTVPPDRSQARLDQIRLRVDLHSRNLFQPHFVSLFDPVSDSDYRLRGAAPSVCGVVIGRAPTKGWLFENA
jgi:hypothetical protein